MSSSPKFQMSSKSTKTSSKSTKTSSKQNDSSSKSTNSSSKDLKSWIMDKDVDPYSLYYYLVGPPSHPFSHPFKPIINNDNKFQNNDYDDYYLEINHMDIENQDSFTDDDFFEKTDILSVNINLEDRNINFIDKKYIDRFKKDILIVNTARGEVVDEDAIIDNITEGRVLGYGTDVIKEEHTPKATNLKITSDPRIIRTPHVGGTAISAQEKAYKRVIEKLN